MRQVILRTSLAVAIIVCLVALILGIRAIRLSLEAEKTLHAHLLVMDVVGVYVHNSGQWPRDWDSMYSVIPSRPHGVWNWPTDAAEIRKRVIVDFSTSSADVARQTPASFSAIEQVAPNFGDDPNAVEQVIEACRQASEKEGAIGHPDTP